MTILGDKYIFSKENIRKAPLTGGVYELYVGDELIYIGRASGTTATINSCLADHFSGKQGRHTQKATAYRREVCSNPAERERALLKGFRKMYRRLPKCNAKKSWFRALLIRVKKKAGHFRGPAFLQSGLSVLIF